MQGFGFGGEWSVGAVLVVYIRRRVEESPIFVQQRALRSGQAAARFFAIFRPPLLSTTILASLLCTGMMGAYYSVTTWLPTYLETERHLSVMGTSTYLLVLIAGSFAGYLGGAWASDALGRRCTFGLFAACGIVIVLTYTRMRVTNAEMLLLGFPLGFFLSGIFSGTGAYLAELYPHEVRGSGQAFCYNCGRTLAATAAAG